MAGYPQDLAALERQFGTEEACRAYLEHLRWPNGFVCPRCQGSKAWSTRRGPRLCAGCGHEASVTSGTIFERTHTPLTVWFRAVWWVTSQKTGASALGLQRVLKLGSYRTAWVCLHKLRRAMVRPGRETLTGRVEVDETFVGGHDPGQGRRHLGSKALVFVAAEVRGRAVGRIRLVQIPNASSEAIAAAVKASIAKGATVVSDGFQSYEMLPTLGYRHEQRVVRGSGRTASSRLPRVHRVASLLKRWLLGTHQGAVRREYLDYYLDEFTFRFNRRTSTARGMLFRRLLEQAVAIQPTTYDAIRKESRSRARSRDHKG
jgi:transposase-like protein